MKPDTRCAYLLIDNGLLHAANARYIETHPESRPAWLAPIYLERGLEVSPLLIDMEAAYEAGGLDQVMGYLNALAPALHVSIIESGLGLEQLARHLRRFIFIVDHIGQQFTLRYADCTVLALLSSALTGTQWATMREPIARWSVHDRVGKILQLPHAEHAPSQSTPLCLDRDQMEVLDEASEPDHVIAKVENMRHGAALPGTAAEQHAVAETAHKAWRCSGNSNQLFLLFLTEAALVSRGEILHRSEVQSFLAMDDLGEFRQKLRSLAHLG